MFRHGRSTLDRLLSRRSCYNNRYNWDPSKKTTTITSPFIAMPSAETDFLIVGQGLAGSILAYQLVESGHSVRVIDNHQHASSSVVAAGIINPITGHRLNITEGFAKYYPIAKQFYQDSGCFAY